MSTFAVSVKSAVDVSAPSVDSSDDGPSAVPSSAEPQGESRASRKELHFSVGTPPWTETRGTIKLFRQKVHLQGLAMIKAGTRVGPSPMLCAMAVPGRLLITDFVRFVAPHHEKVLQMRVVRDERPGRYVVLMLFRSQRDADECFRSHDGRAFSAFETQRCSLAYVSSLEVSHDVPSGSPPLPVERWSSEGAEEMSGRAEPSPVPSELSGPSLATDSLNLSFGQPWQDYTEDALVSRILPESRPIDAVDVLVPHLAAELSEEAAPADEGGSDSHELRKVPSQELPSCPVCLDRLDPSASGILTTMCNHTFHPDCLQSWTGMSCPVCRYFLGEDSQENTACETCGVTTNLWMCLVCGHVGCGRYAGEHGLQHFRETSHTYAVELSTQRVWDYAGDGYVHRLLQNISDGKLVETGGASASEASAGGNLERPRGGEGEDLSSKHDDLAMEYTILLTSQLEAQREWYESRRKEAADAAASREQSLLEQLELEREGRQKAEAKLAALSKEKRLSSLTTARLNDLEEEVAFLREHNKQLSADQHKWKEQVERQRQEMRAVSERAEARIADLEGQARDLMFFLDTQKRLEHEDVRGAAVLVTTDDATAGRATKPSGSRRRSALADRRARALAERAQAARESAHRESEAFDAPGSSVEPGTE
jgi:BRCA1-associated protein